MRKMNKQKKLTIFILAIAVISVACYSFYNYNASHKEKAESKANISEQNNPTSSVTPGNGEYFWEKPTTAYPDLNDTDGLSIEVSVAKQRLYLLKNGTRLCTMTVSTGKPETPTVTGDFYTENRRGEAFYGEQFGGGKYWIAFYGSYLFHSVPIDANGNYIIEEGNKLGTPASHGCVRMSVADSYWFYTHIPAGIPVKIY